MVLGIGRIFNGIGQLNKTFSRQTPNDKLQRRVTDERLWNRKKTALSPVRCKLLLGKSVIWLPLKNRSVPFFVLQAGGLRARWIGDRRV